MSYHPLIGAKTIRQLLGIKAEDVAKRLGITAASYSRHERGERRIYFDKALALANVLGVDINVLTHEPTAEERLEYWRLGERRRALEGLHPGTRALVEGGLIPMPEPAAGAPIEPAPEPSVEDRLAEFESFRLEGDDDA